MTTSGRMTAAVTATGSEALMPTLLDPRTLTSPQLIAPLTFLVHDGPSFTCYWSMSSAFRGLL